MATAKNHRSFTVRLPTALWLSIATLAQDEDVAINAKINQLLRLGLDKHISLDAALKRLLMATITTDEAE